LILRSDFWTLNCLVISIDRCRLINYARDRLFAYLAIRVQEGHIGATATPSWDLVITLVFVIGITYGFIMLRDRILVTLLSLYAGMVVATTLSQPIQKFLNGDIPLLNKVWIEGHASLFTIKAFLFLVTILVIGSKSGLGGRRGQFSFMEMGTYSVLNVCIGLASIFSFMEPEKQTMFAQTSKLAAIVMNHQTLWMIAPLIILAFLGGGSSSRGGGGGGYQDY
jgi:hypothetical protein